MIFFLGNAKIAGITEDIDITPDEYNWSLSIFFIGYVSTRVIADHCCWLAELITPDYL